MVQFEVLFCLNSMNCPKPVLNTLSVRLITHLHNTKPYVWSPIANTSSYQVSAFLDLQFKDTKQNTQGCFLLSNLVVLSSYVLQCCILKKEQVYCHTFLLQTLQSFNQFSSLYFIGSLPLCDTNFNTSHTVTNYMQTDQQVHYSRCSAFLVGDKRQCNGGVVHMYLGHFSKCNIFVFTLNVSWTPTNIYPSTLYH